MSAITINGLPKTLRLDAWWMSGDLDVEFPEPPKASFGGIAKDRRSHGLLIALSLVALADWLFWGWDIGISLALFAAILAALAFAVQTGKRSARDGFTAIAFTTLAILPIIEQVQVLSVLMLIVGLAAYAVWLASDQVQAWGQQVKAMLKFTLAGPFLAFYEAWDGAESVRTDGRLKARVGKELLSWLLPLSVGAMFLVLLSAANPFLDAWIGKLFQLDAPNLIEVRRVVFWVAILCLVWPFLNLLPFAARSPRVAKADRVPRTTVFLNAGSVQKSLILFNALFAFQIISDGLFLWGGASLPDGMSYAEYAHRGAYPLIFTALLAAGFAILTQSFQRERTVRWLVFAWIGQNLMLTYAAIFRLQLYVEAYALTYLRVAAFIWMGLVFLGLALILVQMARGLSVGWLFKWNGAALLSVLYVSCFVNFTALIAGYNISHWAESADHSVDTWYICKMGPHALPAILDFEAQSGEMFCDGWKMPTYQVSENWRDWGFRDWRLAGYLAAKPITD